MFDNPKSTNEDFYSINRFNFNQTPLNDKILKWYRCDHLKKYTENCKNDNKKILEKYHWIDREFTYKFNSNAFRADEFIDDNKPSLMTLGCSHTMGVGIPYEDTWAYLLSNKLGYKNYNLGVGGASNDTCYRFASYWIPKLKPSIVIVMSPNYQRLEFISQDNYSWNNKPNPRVSSLLPQMLYENPMRDLLLLFYEKWVKNNFNGTLNQEKNILAIQQICSKNNIPVYIENSDEYFVSTKITPKDYARDCIHRGVETNKIVAELLYDKYFANNT